MKKILLSALLISLCAAIHLNAQTIKIHVSNYHNEPLMLVYMVGSDGLERKEIKIENNQGSVTVTLPLYTQMSIINRGEKNNIKAGQGIIPGESIMLFAEGKDITVNVDMDKWPVCTIKGGPLAADCMKLWSRTAPLKAQAFEMTGKSVAATNEAESKKYMAEREVLRGKISAMEEQFVPDNPHSYLSLHLLSGQRNTFEIEEFERRLNLLGVKLKALPEAVELAGFISTKKSTAIGCAAPAFEKMDKEGKVVKLSDYKGSYLLIDFWGTWCGPCRNSHPHLVELYRKYSPLGLRFLNVAQEGSVQSRQRWVDAIAQDKLEWTQILNDQGIDKCNMVSLFAVTAFPTKILISPNGKVVSRIVGEDADIDSILLGIFKNAVAKKAVLNGTIDCYMGTGNLLCVSESATGPVYDTIKVDPSGAFVFERDCPNPFMAKVYLEFLGRDRCVYEVYMVNGSTADIAITGARDKAGKMVTDIHFSGEYSAESEFVKNYSKA
ncbi:MAG: TlpA disulfide reductase family protein, partial [Bacteroidales bacterium]